MNPAKLARQINEAAALHQGGDLVGAERLYRAVLKQSPQQPDALHLLGVLTEQRGDRTKGVALVRQALSVQSAFPDAHFNLARMLGDAGDLENAKRHYDRALALKPGHARSHNGLGTIFRAQHAYSEACAAFERAIRFEPRLIEAYINLCNTYRDTCNEAGILKVAAQGLAVDPTCAQLWLLQSEAAFTLGRLAQGWRDYEWRFRTPQRPVDLQPYPLPFWKGEDLSTKGILIWCEQGVGDEIIFASMVSGVAARARRCVLQTTPRLAQLFARSFPSAEVHGTAVPADVVGALDVQSSAGSLGEWCRPTFNSFPAAANYLKADSARISGLREKYRARQKDNLVVGLAWKSTNVSDAAQKSVDLDQWAAILGVPGVTFVNLQYGDNRESIAAARANFGVDIVEDSEVDALADLDTFAAQVAAMDLVISTSNTAAHMAGALGVPTFCMIPRALGSGRRWYWFGEGRHSPWYRSLALFRQVQDSQWSDVLGDVGRALTNVSAQSVSALGDSAQARPKDIELHEILELVDQALQREPRSPDLLNKRGMTLARMGRFEEAAAAYRNALAVAPAQAELYNNLGTALRRAGRAREASENYARAHALKPDHPSIFLNHAMALAEIEKPEEALEALDQLIVIKPDYVEAHYNRALVLMSVGRLAEGWQTFKWRLKRANVHVRYEDFPHPVWTGENLNDKHVLVWTDLGLGDEILLASMVPDLIAAARRVTLLCSERLVSLFRRSFPNITVDVRRSPLPVAAVAQDIDFQMSLTELGAAFRRSFDAFPVQARTLAVDQGRRAALRRKYLEGRDKSLLVGVSWRSINPEIGEQKGVPLARWLPILKLPGITFVSLQYGDCRDELTALQREHGVALLHDPEIDTLGDMDPVAAQVAAMDLVISISNTAVHIAGAAGVPVWVLLPKGHARLWYWFRGLKRCAWYPQARLLSSENEGNWDQLVAACAAELAARAAHRNGDHAAALAAINGVLDRAPSAEAWNLKGDCLFALTQYAAAAEAYAQAASLDPQNAGYAHDLGRALLQSGRPAEAEIVLDRAAVLNPNAWDIYCDLGAAQLELGSAADALKAFSSALALHPTAGMVHFNRGNALLELNRLDEAEASYRAALKCAPTLLPAMMSLGTLVGDLGRRDEALSVLAGARSLAPHEPQIEQATALVRLRYGQLREGFAAYESRFEQSRYGLQKRPFTCPPWRGEDLSGRDILVWTEQGLGDEILSASMFAEVIAAARSCTIECSERAAPLFRRSFTGAVVVARADPPDPATLGRFDYQVAAWSLGGSLRPDFTAFSKRTGYLRADGDWVARLRRKYRSADPAAMVIGISWESTARHGGRKRLPLAEWSPILKLPGITVVSLQYGVGPDDPELRRLGLATTVLVDGEIDAIKSFDASAAQVAAMDLVITVSNTTAHLAGAQGIPVWTLLPTGPGCFWYWFRDRDDSPWYPSMRLMRQPRPGDWQAAVTRVAGALVEIRDQSRL